MKSLNTYLKGIIRKYTFAGDRTPLKALTFVTAVVLFSGTIFSQSKPIIIRTYGVPLIKQRSISQNSASEQTRDISKMERNLFDLVNQKRRESGLNLLNWSEDLARVARMHSRNMASNNFFSHYGRNNTTVEDRAKSLGFSNWRAIGENLAYTQGYDNPVEFSMRQWSVSSSHRRNYLDRRWQTAAIGISRGQNNIYYFTQVFMEY
jgi:uncharacterized protein YkwD